MREGLRPRLTYANVVSTLALFAVLGGGAYATHGHRIGSKDLRKGAVTTAKIKKGAVKAGKLSGSSVGEGKIRAGAVTGAKLAAAAVGTVNLADGAVGTAQLADGAVGAGKLAADSVSSPNVVDGSLTGADVDESSLAVPPAGFAPLPAATVGLSSVQTIPSSGDTFTALNTVGESLDIGDMHGPPNPSRLTAPVTGVYVITAGAGFLPNGTGTRELRIIRNGGTPGTSTLASQKGPATLDQLSVATVRKLNAGQFVEAMVRQSSGGDLNVLPAVTHFSIAWISPG